MIPRIFHRVWLGSDPMPDQYLAYERTWRDHHPDWKFKLWTDDDLPDLFDPDAFRNATSLSGRSDVIRWEVLRQFGGVYADTDVECLRPFDPLLHHQAFAAWESDKHLGSAVVGSVPGHPAFEQAAREVGASVASQLAVSKAAGPQFITKILVGRNDVVILPSEAFYPVPHGEESPLVPEWSENTFTVHHWAGTGKQVVDPEREMERLRLLVRAVQKREWGLARENARIKSTRWWRLGTRLGLMRGS